MKLSYHWLQQNIPGLKVDPESLGEKITLHTAEVEECVLVSNQFKTIVTGKVISIEPATEKLNQAVVDTGTHGHRNLLFGNTLKAVVGSIVPIALPGTTLFDGKVIEEKQMQGFPSQGMICINSEMGMKNPDLEVFPENTPLGIPLSELFPQAQDVLIDIDNKSVTHRPDLWGHQGFYRDIAAALGLKARLFESSQAPENTITNQGEVLIDIQTPNCRRFMACKIKGITVKSSDFGTKLQLENLSTRAISNYVDLTNLVMLDTGQPMHVFDADKVEGQIIVRQATMGETITALDGETYELIPEDTVVADEKKALSIAGIMGGLDSGATLETKNIILEVANWDPTTTRKTAHRLNIRTESSMRYEKSLNPSNCELGMFNALTRANHIQALTESVTITDNYPQKTEQKIIELPISLYQNYTGKNMTAQEQTQKLEALEFTVEHKDPVLQVTCPYHRPQKDISMAQDLIEELVRLEGYQTIEADLPKWNISPAPQDTTKQIQRKIQHFFSQHGYTETMQYSLVPKEASDLEPDFQTITIANPLSSEHVAMRKSLLFHHLQNLESELRQHKNINAFELGKTYHFDTKQKPVEQSEVILYRASLEVSENKLIKQLQADINHFFQRFNGQKPSYKSSSTRSHLHPSKQADICLTTGDTIGTTGTLHPSIIPAKGAKMAVAILQLDQIISIQTKGFQYQKPSSFPEVHRDLSVIVTEKILVGDITKAFASISFLTKSTLFDTYQNEDMKTAKVKNLAFHLSFQSKNHTLTEDEINNAFNQAVKTIKTEFNGTLRLEYDTIKR